MKLFHSRVCLLIALMFLPVVTGQASPYASGITNDGGNIKFILNESGGNVTVIYEDGTTNANFDGITTGTNLSKGSYSFALDGHVSYKIKVRKVGTGTPSLISSDTNVFNIWNSPRGVDVNKNAKVGHLFGRTYIGNSAVGGTGANAKGWGIYALNADMTDSPLGKGTNASTTSIWVSSTNAAPSNKDGPYRMTVAPDGSLFVTDASLAAGGVWQFDPDLNTFSNQVFSPLGQVAGNAAKVIGTPIGVFTTGSIENGNLKVYTADPGLPFPSSTTPGDNTYVGDANILYRYDIGSGPLPWTNSPNFGVNVGLGGFPNSQILDVTVGPDSKIYGMFRRANFSDGNIQVFDPNGQRLFTSLQGSPPNQSDPFAIGNGAYAGVRISQDGRFIATMTIQNSIHVANLTNGIPDMATVITIPNGPTTGNARGLAWDAANNLYACSSGQSLLRVYSLGITTTATTSNDSTGTNGTFEIELPPVSVSVLPTSPNASQNYINSTPTPGVPTPGVLTVTLSTNQLDAPVTIGFTRGGSAAYLVNYTLNTNNTLNGVVVSSNSITFPAGSFPGGGNWSQDIIVTPTATPLVGPTLTATIAASPGSNYLTAPPFSSTVSIKNTGPQFLFLAAPTVAPTGVTMSRAISGDYAKFIIHRWGDLNGPGQGPGSVTPASYTVTNFTFGGAGIYGVDYTAGPQNAGAPGTIVPVDGNPGILIPAGAASVTNIIGNPVAHTDLSLPPTNVTIIISLTNAVSNTNNLTSSEGNNYAVSNNTVTLTEFDNTTGPETVIWSNPMTNSADSTNWTLTFASTNLGASTVLPIVITNYANVRPDPSDAGGTNNFDVTFGYPLANDGVSPSANMVANGWSNVLKMTVNKDFNFPAPSAVNVYPQDQTFSGNYALRFDMYISLYANAINNPFAGNFATEFAEFGINHKGTNCNWRPTQPITPLTGGSGVTNSDGIWFAIGANPGSLTPADFDGFSGRPLPNDGPVEPVSSPAFAQSGVFKHPPFVAPNTTGGTPVNKWVDVSVEVTRQTNISLFIARAQVLNSFHSTNGHTNGTIMLGYLDPLQNVSDSSAFVYYSNVRVVQLSPTITAQPISQIVTQGATVSFTSAAAFGTAPMTNIWYTGTATTPVTAIQTDIINSTAATNILSLTNVTSARGTNYYSVWRDASGSVTSLVSTLVVVTPPPNVVSNAGTIAKLTVTAVGPSAPTYQWKTNGVNLVNHTASNPTRMSGVTAAILVITNAQSADANTYACLVTNAFGAVQVSGTLSIVNAATGAAIAPATQTNLWGSTATFTVSASGTSPFTYRWKTNGINLANGSHYSGATSSTLVISNVTTLDERTYTVGVSNSAGGVLSSPATLAVFVPAPTFSNVSVASGNATISFNSTNIYDTTNAFDLLSATVVQGPYTNTPASFTTSGDGSFQVTVPQNGDSVFYKLMHKQ